MNRKKRENGRFFGWVLTVLGAALSLWPIMSVNRNMKRAFGYLPFRVRWGRVFQVVGRSYVPVLAVGVVMLLAGIVLILANRQRVEFWRTQKRSRIKSVGKKIAAMTDTAKLDEIARCAPLREVKDAAAARRRGMLQALLDSGSDPAALREAVRRAVEYDLYKKDSQDFLAEAAKKYPEIVREFWPKLESWAHADSRSHEDQKPGFHTDRTDYYDYFRYPDGRTRPNLNGRKRHTDTRGGYSDCHEDHHKDVNTHTDRANADKIARFKPWIREDADRPQE